MRFVLYVRLGCHLCEDAAQALQAAGVRFVRINVDLNPRLNDEYGALVPVLHDRESDREWAYPFDAREIADTIR